MMRVSWFAYALGLMACGVAACAGSANTTGGNGSSGGSGSSSGASGSSSGSHTGSSSGSHTGSSSGTTSSSSSGGVVGDGGFGACTLAGGCPASLDCSAPANDPIAATGMMGGPMYDIYDGCILSAMVEAGMTDPMTGQPIPWMGQLLKAQAINESGIVTSIALSTDPMNSCGGQNCGIYAISAGAVSGDPPPGPCGVKAADPPPGSGGIDYSHSYGIFQSTPACEGTFIQPLPSGQTCTPTGTVNDIPFKLGMDYWYCETATSQGVQRLDGTMVKGAINAVQDKSSPYYPTSVFNAAYQLYVYISFSWKYNFQAANAKATGCTLQQQWYLSLAYWLTGSQTTTCKPNTNDGGLMYVQSALGNYQMLFGKAFPYPGP